MSLIHDVFESEAFSAVELTASINVVPNSYGRLQEMNLFPGQPIPTTHAAIEYQNGKLNLLPMRARGGPSSLGSRGKKSARLFQVPHVPHDDMVTAADVQNYMALGGGLDSVADHVNRKLSTMRRKHAITLEWYRMKALQGVILDADASTFINYFTEFGVTEKSVNFALGTTTTNVAGKCREVVRHIEDNLTGEVMTGVHGLCDSGFWDALIGHAKVEEAYKYYASTQEPLRRDVRMGFEFHGIVFEEYRGTASALNEDGTTTARPFIPANTCRFFPVGTTETFGTYFAPPDILSEVNMAPGQEIYADTAIDPKFGRFVEIHTQSNPLPFVARPSLLVKGTTS